MRTKLTFFLMPIAVILVTRVGIELNLNLFPASYAWMPSFLIYYVSIVLCFLFASRKLGVKLDLRNSSFRPLPHGRYLVWGVVVPAILPLGVFIMNARAVPPLFFVWIVIFALINPLFEEIFWRGLLAGMPAGTLTRNLYSSSLFGFSHYFMWGTYWLSGPTRWIPTVLTTFIMGLLWMWFYEKRRNLLYPIVSHFFVDVFNLSVAVFYGLKLVTF